jgi:hypothetical protein
METKKEEIKHITGGENIFIGLGLGDVANKRKMTEEEKVNYFNSKRDWLNISFDILKNRLNKTNNLDMINIMVDHICKLIEDIDVYRIEDLKQQLINQINTNERIKYTVSKLELKKNND